MPPTHPLNTNWCAWQIFYHFWQGTQRLCLPVYFPVLFWKDVYSKRIEFAPKLFPFRVDPFSEGGQTNFDRVVSLKAYQFLKLSVINCCVMSLTFELNKSIFFFQILVTEQFQLWISCPSCCIFLYLNVFLEALMVRPLVRVTAWFRHMVCLDRLSLPHTLSLPPLKPTDAEKV